MRQVARSTNTDRSTGTPSTKLQPDRTALRRHHLVNHSGGQRDGFHPFVVAGSASDETFPATPLAALVGVARGDVTCRVLIAGALILPRR